MIVLRDETKKTARNAQSHAGHGTAATESGTAP